ncbi:hypothetical protein BCV69DRAFT_315297 [Microstroma glucosiphilum]|uniref:Uncharacterized protein n=1 Tax=Pseudomicrostroma glucosiphilum TaxID=1684307 RepID=A0A316U442_9BASI|nr:hypothetical protein BCV69DRAFT_315297 [Pseudomicrostroma glucosiphilum]PWN17695.1 hypothetical protein BCV69DRAFT_315297 [Pseudomicrostroma glucosiphilum]
MERRAEPPFFKHQERVYSKGYLRAFDGTARQRWLGSVRTAKEALRKKDRADFQHLDWSVAWQSAQSLSPSTPVQVAAPTTWIPPLPTEEELNAPFGSFHAGFMPESEDNDTISARVSTLQYSFYREMKERLAEAENLTGERGRGREAEETEAAEESEECNTSSRIIEQEGQSHRIGFIGFAQFSEDAFRRTPGSLSAVPSAEQKLELEVNVQVAMQLDTLNVKAMNICLDNVINRLEPPGEAINLAWVRMMQKELDALFYRWHENGQRVTRAYYKHMDTTGGQLTPLSRFSDTTSSSGKRLGRSSIRAKATEIALVLLARCFGPDLTGAFPSAFVRPMDPLLESKVHQQLVESSEWLKLDDEWDRLFRNVGEKLRDFYTSTVLDTSAASGSSRRGMNHHFELPWLPVTTREVYSERDVYSRIFMMELLREGCGQIIKVATTQTF